MCLLCEFLNIISSEKYSLFSVSHGPLQGLMYIIYYTRFAHSARTSKFLATLDTYKLTKPHSAISAILGITELPRSAPFSKVFEHLKYISALFSKDALF